jgi:hypothetical protein
LKQTAPSFFKKFLTQIGARMSAHSLHQLQMVINYMKLGRWMVKNNFPVQKRLPDREAVFAAVADQVRDRQVLYLEFGVYQGAIGLPRSSTLTLSCTVSIVSRACRRILIRMGLTRRDISISRGRSRTSTTRGSGSSRAGSTRCCPPTSCPTTRCW